MIQRDLNAEYTTATVNRTNECSLRPMKWRIWAPGEWTFFYLYIVDTSRLAFRDDVIAKVLRSDRHHRPLSDHPNAS